MIKNGTVMTAVASVAMIIVSLILANSADRIKPPTGSVVASTRVDKANDIVPDTDPAIARGALRRILASYTVAPKARAPAPAPVQNPVPSPPKAPTTRRIAMIGAVTGENGATTYWFRDLAGTAIYPLAQGGDDVDGWRLVSISKGVAVLSIDGEIYQVKEK
jgi:hypothetical protein